MSRPPRKNEVPVFGQVWRWDDGNPLMAIAETPTYTTGPSLAGVSRSWMFMRISDSFDQGTLTNMWWTAGDEVMGEWELLDE